MRLMAYRYRTGSFRVTNLKHRLLDVTGMPPSLFIQDMYRYGTSTPS